MEMFLRKLLAIAIVSVMMVTAFSLVSFQGRAGMGTTDAYGYRWIDSDAPDPTISFEWVDISATGTDSGVSGDDSWRGPFPIGFDFSYYGNSYSAFNISSNGYIMFDANSYTPSNIEIPSSWTPNNIVAAYWDDLVVDVFNNDAVVYFETVGIAPERQLVVEFYNMVELGSSDLMEFEIMLNETGEIWFQYGSMNGNTGSFATVGIEDALGTTGCQYSFDSASLSDDLAIMFSKTDITVGPDMESWAKPGESAEYLLTVTNGGPTDDSFDIYSVSTEASMVEFLDSLLNPLTDHNGNGIPDTGVIISGSSMDVVVMITLPVSPSSLEDVTIVTAAAYDDPINIGTAYLTTYVIEAVFSSPQVDYVEDTDSDGLYNTMSVNLTLDVFVAGSYGVNGVISMPAYPYLASTDAYGDMEVGLNTINLTFDTRIFNGCEVDGPYPIDLTLYAVNGNWTSDHLTPAYSWTQFDPPEIRFNTPITDYGRDTNGDSYYDLLIVEATVDITEAGDYLVFANIEDAYGELFDGASNDSYLGIGTYGVEIEFSGPAIRSGEHDGPFIVNLYAIDATMSTIDRQVYTTAEYTYDEFQPAASFCYPYSDYGLDADSNGLYEYLIVEVNVTVTYNGYYSFFADLYAMGSVYVESYSDIILMDPGTWVVQMSFSGSVIREVGMDCNFTVDFYVMYSGSYMDGDNYLTSHYYADDFEGDASFISPHYEYTIDIDSDDLYDCLILSFTLNVTSSGYYSIEAYLYDVSSDFVAYGFISEYFSAGTRYVDVEVAGWQIRSSGYDGPYTGFAYLYDASWTLLDTYEFTTEYYAYAEFELPSELSPPYDESVSDTDSDGLFDLLVVTVPVTITVPGDFHLNGVMRDSLGSYITSSWDSEYLSDGYREMELYFQGEYIFESGVDGPYTIEMVLYDYDYDVLDSDTYLTDSYTYDEFQPPPSYFGDVFSDFPVDDSGDDLYEHLVAVVSVEITTAGEYMVAAYIRDAYWSEIQWVQNTTYLEVGLHEVELWFDGPAIRAVASDGPYRIYATLYDDQGMWLDSDSWYTSYYGYTEFQPAALFYPPHSDHGYDEDDDGLYEYLVLDVSVEAYIDAELMVEAFVYDEDYNFMAVTETIQYCEAGISVVSVNVNGWDILENHVDGPYFVYLYLYYFDETIDLASYTTGSYAFNDFSQIPAQFAAPHSDHGLDDDADGYYEYMVVEVRVNVTLPGTYMVEAMLSTYTDPLIDSAVVEATLSEGLQTVEVMFDGWLIAINGYDGLYYVEMDLYRSDGTYLDSDVHLTSLYSADEFDLTVPVIDSYWASEAPVIDGMYSEGEWEDATAVSILLADPNNLLDAVIQVLNNGTHLFICIDAIGDTTMNPADGAAVAFETGNDDTFTPGHEDRFVIFGSGAQEHEIYSSYSDYDTDCSPFDTTLPDHDGLAGVVGFCPSDQLSIDHRVYEFCIPLDLIMASPGDILGFLGAVVDYSTNEISYWPVLDEYIFQNPSWFGDLVLYSSAPPTTTVDLSGTEGANGWYTSEVEFTLTSEDAEEGVNLTSYRLDGGVWSDYASPVTVSAEGSHTLEFYSIDLAGNRERVQEVSINIDMTAPEAMATSSGTIGEDDWFTSGVTISFACSDGSLGSGIATVTARLDGGLWIEDVSSWRISGDGIFLLEYYCTDVAGISSSIEEITVKSDATAPETTASVDGSMVTLSGTDSISGVYLTKYRIDGGEWTNYTVPFEVPGSGNHSVEFYSIDNAGNAGDISLQFLDNGSGGSTVFGVDLWSLIMVLLVIAILAGIAIPAIFGMRRKAKDADTKAIIKDAMSPVAQLVDDNPQPFPPKAPEPELPAGEEKPPKTD